MVMGGRVFPQPLLPHPHSIIVTVTIVVIIIIVMMIPTLTRVNKNHSGFFSCCHFSCVTISQREFGAFRQKLTEKIKQTITT